MHDGSAVLSHVHTGPADHCLLEPNTANGHGRAPEPHIEPLTSTDLARLIRRVEARIDDLVEERASGAERQVLVDMLGRIDDVETTISGARAQLDVLLTNSIPVRELIEHATLQARRETHLMYQQSLCWRVTAPLRFFGDRIRR